MPSRSRSSSARTAGGDGNLLSLLRIDAYTGVDVSDTVLDGLRRRFPDRCFVPFDAIADLPAADLALGASGTATLETALFKTPMVIVYKQSPVTWALMKRMLYLPYIGLPNILAGEVVVPEFIQEKATPGALAEALLELQQDTAAQRRQVAAFHAIHGVLRQDTARKAADAVLSVIDGAGR